MPGKESKREKAKEVVDILEEISILLVRDSIGLSTKLTIKGYWSWSSTTFTLCLFDWEWCQPWSTGCQSFLVWQHHSWPVQDAIKELRKEVATNSKAVHDVRPESSVSDWSKLIIAVVIIDSQHEGYSINQCAITNEYLQSVFPRPQCIIIQSSMVLRYTSMNRCSGTWWLQNIIRHIIRIWQLSHFSPLPYLIIISTFMICVEVDERRHTILFTRHVPNLTEDSNINVTHQLLPQNIDTMS